MTDTPIIFQSTKTYTHAHGYSCCFRQWRADHSHCHFLHGYSIEVRIVFEGPLDKRNWVMDYGGLSLLKDYLRDHFDHKTLVAKDDPQLREFRNWHNFGIIDIVEVDAVGCEKFAEMIFRFLDEDYSKLPSWAKGVIVRSVEVKEHAGNSAIVTRKD